MSNEFEGWFDKQAEIMDSNGLGFFDKVCARGFAEAAWEAARKDHYRIGEEVEVSIGYAPSVRGKVVALYDDPAQGDNTEDIPENVRRVPEWEPKEGESVLFEYPADNKACPGIWTEKGIVALYGNFGKRKVIPFCIDKIGKPWGEI